jgi:integrase
MDGWTKTEEPGIYRDPNDETRWRVFTTAKAPDGSYPRRQKTLTEASMSDAIRVREQLKAEIRAPDEAEASSPTTKYVVDFAKDWATRMKTEGRWNERTYETTLQILESHILPDIGGIEVDDLRREDIRRWIETIEQKTYEQGDERKRYSRHSLRRFWSTMKALVKNLYLESHVDRRFIEWCREIRGPTSEIGGRRTADSLTLNELHAFLDATRTLAESGAISARWEPHIVTLAWTGMRFGESAGLEWRDVDFDDRVIYVRRSFSQGRLGPPKSGETRRIGMVDEVADALHQQRQLLVAEQNLGLDDDIVFPSDKGTRRWSSSIHTPMKRAAAEADINVDVGPQVLRSTLDTLLDDIGESAKLIKSVIGHKTDEMSEHYDRKRPETQIAALDRLKEVDG